MIFTTFTFSLVNIFLINFFKVFQAKSSKSFLSSNPFQRFVSSVRFMVVILEMLQIQLDRTLFSFHWMQHQRWSRRQVFAVLMLNFLKRRLHRIWFPFPASCSSWVFVKFNGHKDKFVFVIVVVCFSWLYCQIEHLEEMVLA